MRVNGPNILVTGTPGVGKTTLCCRFADESRLRYLNVADLIRDEELHAGWDDELECSIYDDKLLRKALKKRGLRDGGFLLDFHSVEGISKKDIDHVVVLSAEIETLCARLKERGYSDKKIDSNIEAEIFQVCLQDAVELFGEDRVTRLPHNTEEESLKALEHVKKLVESYG
ncbi:TAF9 RNA polymerase TATA box binding protein associated factor isoform 2 family protein [Babesia ovata]|uniref:Adenylate kinase isoenzyme 6 homolog n=1 Tax=Babesia ovata TaxID=189622 RepID=A0A2H6KCZ6_9APIC|nr:TAF9 RNA polymerase TATA box binding protein associated factor isoform 2 family protein [Babesia ovata]GBE60868.1 TAF9 RNA polymerase TATA box binding protein associated factor isoform 2 family protein [Babesia ovata]